MFKKLPLAFMMGTLLTASNVLALGVGDIKVNSALNQRLDAEIELLSSVEGELDEVAVRLASQEAFDRIRLTRPFHLTDIKFKVTTRADGTPVVKLSTPENVREPFLNFLIEVSWPKGRMLREYTVLLDPPVTMASRPEPVTQAPVVPTPPSGPAETAPYEPDQSGDIPADGGVADTITPVTPSHTGDTYGPIAAQETLWSIANQVKSGGVSTQQMMLALFDANPDAFINGDIHHVRKGAVLRIPAESAVNVRDYADAVAEVRQLNASLDLASTSEQAGIPEAMVETEAPSAAEDSAAAPEQQPVQQDELNIVAPVNASSAGTGSASADVDALKRELALATETMASQKLENEELKSRVQELEGTVSEMDKLRRLLELQNEEMARLQGQLADDTGEQVSDTGEQLDTGKQLNDIGELAETGTAGASVAAGLTESESAGQMASKSEQTAQPASEDISAETAAAESEPAPVEPPAPAKPVPAKPAPRPAPPPPPPVKKEPMDIAMDYINQAKNDPTILGIIAAVVIVFIALIVLVLRRRKAKTADEDAGGFTMEVVSEGDSDGDDGKSSGKKFALGAVGAGLFAGLASKFGKKKTADDIGYEEDDADNITEQNLDVDEPAAAPPAADDTTDDATIFEAPEPDDQPSFDDMMFEEDDTSEGFDPAATTVGDPEPEPVASESDEPDPLEEVDVYEAFGDFEQAAEIVKQAVADQPDNNAFKLRLFKVYQNGGMNAEFSKDAVAYKEAMQGSSEWDEVVSIGQSFAPDSPAWGEGGVSPAAPAADASDMVETVAQAPADSGANDLDFELGDTADISSAVENEEPAASDAGDSNELEFDLGDLDFESADSSDTAASGNAPVDEPTEDDAVDNSMEFNLGDLDFESADAPALEEEVSGAASAVDNSMEFDLGDLDFEPADSPAEKPAAEIDDDMTLDADLGLDFELDASQSESADVLEEAEETLELNMSEDELLAESESSSDVPDSEDPTILFPEEENEDGAVTEGADVSMGVDLSDFSFDIEESGSEEALSMDDNPAESADFLAEADEALSAIPDGTDEVATKLDLARAYIDMGDADGAKNILEEVVSEGNEAQKQEAEELLQKT